MAVTAASGRPRWTILLRPRWLVWHGFVVFATAGMLWLGDWQLHRAESGNELSWAYTFEWPLFAIFCVYFWAKSLRDELKGHVNTEVTGATGPATEAPDPAAQAVAADAYVERLKAEVRRHGGWHGWR
jgi:DNA-binding transcriptional regulator of glucitol operon